MASTSKQDNSIDNVPPMYQCIHCKSVYEEYDKAVECLQFHQDEYLEDNIIQPKAQQTSFMCSICDTNYLMEDAAQACMAAHVAMMSKVEEEKQEGPAPKKKKKDNLGSKGSRQHNWTRINILALIEKVKENYPRLQDKMTKANTVWNEIAAELKEKDKNMTGDVAAKKWTNLKYKYKKFIDNSYKTGKAAMKKPEFYEEMNEILQGSHALRPQNVLQCGLNPNICLEKMEMEEMEGHSEVHGEKTQSHDEKKEVQASQSGRSSRSGVLSPLLPESLVVPEEPVSPVGRKEKRIRPPSRSESVERSIKDLVNLLKESHSQENRKIKLLEDDLTAKNSFREIVVSHFDHEKICSERYNKLEAKMDKRFDEVMEKIGKIIEIIS